jgi:uncharacterized protein (TIGR02217 family)
VKLSDITKASIFAGDFDEATSASRFLMKGGRHYVDHLIIYSGMPDVFIGNSYTLETESLADQIPSFPIPDSQGTAVGPSFKTELLKVSSGHELRDSVGEDDRHGFEVSLQNKNQVEAETLIALNYISRGRGRTFRFKNWLDFNTTTPDGVIGASDQTIGTGDGVNRVFQLIKTYFKDLDKSNVDHISIIRRPVVSTVLISIDDALESSANYRIDSGMGRLIFNTAPLQDEIIKWGGEFDIACRFESDILGINMQAFKLGQSTFSLIEVI